MSLENVKCDINIKVPAGLAGDLLSQTRAFGEEETDAELLRAPHEFQWSGSPAARKSPREAASLRGSIPLCSGLCVADVCVCVWCVWHAGMVCICMIDIW